MRKYGKSGSNGEGGKDKPVLKTIKVKGETYKELIKMISVLQLEFEERVSFDTVIDYLLHHVPEAEVDITLRGEGEDSSEGEGITRSEE